MTARKCPGCDGPVARYLTYCTAACGKRHARKQRAQAAKPAKPTQKCVECGKPFPTSRDARYCSPLCSGRANTRRVRQRTVEHLATMVPATGPTLPDGWSGFGDILGQLVIAAPWHPSLRSGLLDMDRCEMFDAAHEDCNGRLPHEPGFVG